MAAEADVNPRPPRERFFRTAGRAAAPLGLWALHFFVAYAVVAGGCMRRADGALTAGVLAAVTAVAVGALAAMLWRSMSRCRRAAPGTGRGEWLRLGAAVLALVAVAWTVVPMAVLPMC